MDLSWAEVKGARTKGVISCTWPRWKGWAVHTVFNNNCGIIGFYRVLYCFVFGGGVNSRAVAEIPGDVVKADWLLLRSSVVPGHGWGASVTQSEAFPTGGLFLGRGRRRYENNTRPHSCWILTNLGNVIKGAENATCVGAKRLLSASFNLQAFTRENICQSQPPPLRPPPRVFVCAALAPGTSHIPTLVSRPSLMHIFDNPK